jgi:hypothetical protein
MGRCIDEAPFVVCLQDQNTLSGLHKTIRLMIISTPIKYKVEKKT